MKGSEIKNLLLLNEENRKSLSSEISQINKSLDDKKTEMVGLTEEKRKLEEELNKIKSQKGELS